MTSRRPVYADPLSSKQLSEQHQQQHHGSRGGAHNDGAAGGMGHPSISIEMLEQRERELADWERNLVDKEAGINAALAQFREEIAAETSRLLDMQRMTAKQLSEINAKEEALTARETQLRHDEETLRVHMTHFADQLHFATAAIGGKPHGLAPSKSYEGPLVGIDPRDVPSTVEVLSDSTNQSPLRKAVARERELGGNFAGSRPSPHRGDSRRDVPDYESPEDDEGDENFDEDDDEEDYAEEDRDQEEDYGGDGGSDVREQSPDTRRYTARDRTGFASDSSFSNKRAGTETGYEEDDEGAEQDEDASEEDASDDAAPPNGRPQNTTAAAVEAVPLQRFAMRPESARGSRPDPTVGRPPPKRTAMANVAKNFDDSDDDF